MLRIFYLLHVYILITISKTKVNKFGTSSTMNIVLNIQYMRYNVKLCDLKSLYLI